MCTFCHKEVRRNEKNWDSLFKWLQSCQLSLSEHNYLNINRALGRSGAG